MDEISCSITLVFIGMRYELFCGSIDGASKRDTPPTDAIGTAITPKLAICQAFATNTRKPPEESQGALMKGRGVKNYALGP
jgi:hypothetical protein